ncbi:MAG: transcription-repair coupling factor [Clostridiales Family XIII bacterium]|jgi:transcription-repair coupling factor (superfamily II helicase)|nr:transcription-repair coupling factor [Clostridiales Family XIII bacterium]
MSLKRLQKQAAMSKNLRKVIHVSGLADAQIAPYAARELMESGQQCLIVTASASKANELAKTLSFFLPWKIYVIQEEESFFMQYEAKSHGQMEARLEALAGMRKGEQCVVIAPVSGVLKKLPPPETCDRYRLVMKEGDSIDLDHVKRMLTAMGFERTPFVEAKGQFSQRGGVLDIFAVDSPAPYRLDLFDSEIDSIKIFHLESQRSDSRLESIEIWPAEQMIIDREVFKEASIKIGDLFDRHINSARGDRAAELKARKRQLLDYIESAVNLQLLENYVSYFYDGIFHIWDYMRDGVVMLDDPTRLLENIELLEREAEADFGAMLEKGHCLPEDYENFSGRRDFEGLFEQESLYIFTPFSTRPEGVSIISESRNIAARRPPVINGRMDMLEEELRRYIKNKYRVTIVCSVEDRADSLRDFLGRADLIGLVELKLGKLSCGMEFPEEKRVYLWEGDIFSSPKFRSSRKRDSKNAAPIKSFTDITKGDYVVHENHGIGKFLGIEQLDIQNVRRDYLKIKYAGEDVLYIPVEQMSLVQKYIGGGDAEPRISKLSSSDWKKAKAKAKKDIANMAKELLDVTAARKTRKGYAFAGDTIWQKEFEDKFPYTETNDQLRSVESIKKDMEKPVPMDRLLCGDVGYGKTEVAARAVFKCVADGKQAAVLVPTTILANQHYHTFKDRFEEFPFEVEMLSRFRTEKQQAAIIEKLGRGGVDIIIGTHRMLSKDIKFKDLGLLVVDEEQRFGVKHKEIIKALKKDVDVLTLSATPIPRTLHMSMVGIRDMDIIEEPPEDRYPVQTYVMEHTDEVVKETVRRELDRGGQVYVVYNRVNGIQRVAAEIKALAPEAEIAVGHGQMNEQELENVMMDFIDGRYNVLVSTTIIESGIDIPNVNTILIMDAGNFGLSQLYQLRGRVGRSNRMAYAYLLYRKDKMLTEAAEKRMRAIREFTEFGAGFRIAMRDLEIRGAGNLLGTEQHGNMMSIGYELYCKLVDDAVRALEGAVVNPDSEDVSFEIPVTAFIPQAYIEDEILKLQMYKKIAFVETEEDERDVVDELIDRFGDVPEATLNLIKIAKIRAAAKRAGIIRVREAQRKYMFELRTDAPIGAEDIKRLKSKYNADVLIHGGAKPFMSLRQRDSESSEKLKEIMAFVAAVVI